MKDVKVESFKSMIRPRENKESKLCEGNGYHCTKCDKTFRTDACLRIHIKIIHMGERQKKEGSHVQYAKRHTKEEMPKEVTTKRNMELKEGSHVPYAIRK